MTETTKHAKAKHTPGPWRAEMARNNLGDDFPGYWLVTGPDNAGVADLFGEVRSEQDEDGDDKRLPDAVVEANGRLIAAAPDLLKELKHLLLFLEPLEREGDLDVPGLATLNGARAAIAKAEGRS